MSVLNQSGEEQVECPLCLEPLEVDDLNFFPCTCGYQICRFCWHRIRTDENGLCPACRKAYSENPADFKPLSQEEMARLKAEKRHKDQQRKQKITENRKHLANIRVVQRNLVFVVGLPMRLADAEVLKKHEYFGKFGKIQKVVINQSTSYAGSQGPSASAYVTYHKADDALRAIQAVNNISVDGRTIKTSLGTTKYCSHFMKNQPCPKPDCMYLHELGDTEASFTKEEMQQGKHQEYEKKLHEQLLNTVVRERKPTPSPPAVTSNVANCNNIYQGSNTSPGSNCSQSCSKEAWPSLQPGSNGNFGLSGGTGNGNNSNNINSSAIKGEGSQRRQMAKANNSHKKRHTSGEENRGKAKEKCQSDEQSKTNTSLSSSSNDLHQNISSSNNSSSSSMSELTNGPTNEVDLENEEDLVNVENSCTMIGANGRQQNSGRIFTTNHRATLFEPDNNSFFSTNNFTKVAATNSGSAAADWPISGLTLTHMPDVLPPVHSSEDWQAAFGFTNSQHAENSCITMPMENEHIHPGSTVDHGFKPNDQQQSQNFKNNLENKSPLGEGVAVFSSPPSNLGEEFDCTGRVGGHKPVDEASANANLPNGSQQPIINSTISTNPTANTQHMFASIIHPDGTVVMMQHQYNLAGTPQIVANGLSHFPNSSKFLNDFHLRQQQSQNSHNHSPIFETVNLGCRNSSNTMNVNGKFGMMGGKNVGECNVESESELQNGGDCISGFLTHQQKNLEMEYKNRDVTNLKVAAENEAKDGGKMTDDEGLGFDPFHETQKALAEMMEKENLITMQNKLPTSHGVHDQHGAMNHLTQQLYQQCQVNHMNHQLPPGSLFAGSKLLNSFNGRNQQILVQQNHRLPPPNMSGCAKLMEGLGLGPTSASPMGASAPTRTRLPPPGFTTAPNHMNAFGLGIPRAPSNSSSKILPFMGLGNGPSSSNNGASSPIPQTVANNMVHPQPVIFPSTGTLPNNNSHTFGLQNGIVNSGVPKATGEAFGVKDWSDNIRSLLPGLNSNSHGQFQTNNSSPPPPVFAPAPTPPMSQKGWTGIGPCTDWTALDPAIVSSSCQANFLAAPTSNHHPSTNPGLQLIHNANSLQQNNTGQWLRSLSSEENAFYGSNVLGGGSADWAANGGGGTVPPQQNRMVGSPNSGSIMMAPPPPGFSSMRLPGMQQGTISAKKQNSVVNAEVRKIEIPDVNQSEVESKEEDRMEGLR